MYKENGRKKAADKKEVANLRLFNYVCKNCGAKKVLDTKVFGSQLLCDCGGELATVALGLDLN
ncbi:MAG TPA: hypothetical protein VI911_00825 [Patescibacteria group bacterium]|nr:hypothetical protein [Patescibacteria group bacterium]